MGRSFARLTGEKINQITRNVTRRENSRPGSCEADKVKTSFLVYGEKGFKNCGD
jgi:hypothetical protein